MRREEKERCEWGWLAYRLRCRISERVDGIGGRVRSRVVLCIIVVVDVDFDIEIRSVVCE